jgi:hypothetical protein
MAAGIRFASHGYIIAIYAVSRASSALLWSASIAGGWWATYYQSHIKDFEDPIVTL